MLHLVMSSPFTSSALTQCLAYRAVGEPVVLLEDAVIAAAAPAEAARLQGIDLYVLDDDLKGRGLSARVGQAVTMVDLVDLIVRHGSPHRWAD